MSNLNALREGGVAHPSHDFTAEEIERIESLSSDEIQALISALEKLGKGLAAKKSTDDTHPDTILL